MSTTYKDITNVLFSYKTLVHAIAGSTGSVVAMTAFFPLDTVRSRMQLEDRVTGSTLKVLKELISKEGPETLYRGIVPVLESLCASNFVYFYTFHGLKLLQGKNAEQTALKDLMLASVAGIVNVLTTTPFWVVNTRLKMKGVHATAPQYSGLLDGLTTIATNEGITKLWAGTIPSLFLVANPAIQFMTYEAVKRQLLEWRPEGGFGSLTFFFVGAFSKTVATLLTYPLQIVQTKQRHGHGYPDLRKDAGTIELTLYIIRKYGFKGLYKGMEAKLWQTVLTAALMFATYEKIAAFVFKLLLATKTKVAQ